MESVRAQKPPVISVRKRPLQARSAQLVADILEAAVRVLASDGALHFTTARVAEKAGVSVGSLYQYFPNKEAILFRLQADEWRETRVLLERILADSTRPPFERLRGAVQAFFLTERQEIGFRKALDDATPLYRDTREAHENWKAYTSCLLVFMNEALPQAPVEERAFAADMIATVMSAVGERISEQARSESEVNAMAAAIGEMFCAYLEEIKSRFL